MSNLTINLLDEIISNTQNKPSQFLSSNKKSLSRIGNKVQFQTTRKVSFDITKHFRRNAQREVIEEFMLIYDENNNKHDISYVEYKISISLNNLDSQGFIVDNKILDDLESYVVEFYSSILQATNTNYNFTYEISDEKFLKNLLFWFTKNRLIYYIDSIMLDNSFIFKTLQKNEKVALEAFGKKVELLLSDVISQDVFDKKSIDFFDKRSIKSKKVKVAKY